ncbi:hypothetical protein ACFV4M_07005 [Kitasatospora indigofera]|uniref:hypothetical protein n=1 Tax=Kitasatospora indigofera TaxID=67307 RepID=UPI003648876C
MFHLPGSPSADAAIKIVTLLTPVFEAETPSKQVAVALVIVLTCMIAEGYER